MFHGPRRLRRVHEGDGQVSPRNTPIHASDAALNRLSYEEWLNPADIGVDPENIHNLILKTRPALNRDMLLAYFYERLTYRELAERFGLGNKRRAHLAVRHALDDLKRRLEWQRTHRK